MPFVFFRQPCRRVRCDDGHGRYIFGAVNRQRFGFICENEGHIDVFGGLIFWLGEMAACLPPLCISSRPEAADRFSGTFCCCIVPLLPPPSPPPPLPGSSFRLTLSDDVFAFVASLALLALRCVLAFVGWMVGGSIGYVACLLALPL